MFWKIALAMLAFAANSVLCRLALVGQHIDPMSFTSLRVSSGAVVLMLLFFSRPHRHKIEWNGLHAVFLAVYMLAFSIAYLKIDAGVGALLLFGTVQLSMVLYAVWRGERVSLPRGIGLVLAFAGIVFLLLPGAQAPDLKYSLVMILSGLAWGAYSIVGQRNQDPLSSSLANFLLAVPLVLISTVLLNMDRYFDVQGIVLAILSGGFQYFAEYLQAKLGIDEVHANVLDVENGLVTGEVKGHIVDGARKALLLRELADKMGISLEQAIAVGDGANDLPMLSIAGLGVAFRAKPLVRQNANQAISSVGLDGVLYLLGVHDKDLNRA